MSSFSASCALVFLMYLFSGLMLVALGKSPLVFLVSLEVFFILILFFLGPFSSVWWFFLIISLIVVSAVLGIILLVFSAGEVGLAGILLFQS